MFSHIVLNVFDIMLSCFNNSIVRLLCEIVVTKYCLLSSEKKSMKHSMSCACLWCSCCFCMCWCNELLQCNAFNIHIYITSIVFRLNLVCKTSYHSLIIITTTQHILLCAASFGYFTAYVTTAISTYNVYARKVKCELLYCYNIETCVEISNRYFHNNKLCYGV